MHSTIGLVLIFGGAFLIYEALAPAAHKITTAAPPANAATPGSSGSSGFDPGVGAGSGAGGGGGSAW